MKKSSKVPSKAPLILILPGVSARGFEFQDRSISLSDAYPIAVRQAGGLPFICPPLITSEDIAECVGRCDGVLLTGGDDVEPRLYSKRLPKQIAATVGVTPDQGMRDMRELLVVREVFAQRKPLLALCRGHQLLNVALGGTLIADIPKQLPRAIKHNRQDRRSDIVHEVRLTDGSLIARMTGTRRLGVNSTHHQAIGRVAAPLTPSALSTDGVVEGLELHRTAAGWLPFLLSVQFHPERLVDRYQEHRAIFRGFVSACSRVVSNL